MDSKIHRGTKRIVVLDPIAIEIVDVATLKGIRKVGLLGNADTVLRHLLHRFVRRHHSKVIQVVPMIDARQHVQRHAKFIDDQFDRRIANSMNPRLPSGSIQFPNRGGQLRRVDTELATIFSLTFVWFLCVGSRSCESPVHKDFDRAHTQVIIAITGLQSKGRHRLRTFPEHLDRPARQFIAIRTIDGLPLRPSLDGAGRMRETRDAMR